MLLNMSTKISKIYHIVNNTEKVVGPNFLKDFEAEYHKSFKKNGKSSYKSKEYFGKSVLEFILKRYGMADQRNWEHDSVFPFALDIILDWKSTNMSTGNASITSKDTYGKTTYYRNSTHYGFLDIQGNPFELGSKLKFKLLDLQTKEYVWSHKEKEFDNFFLYKPVT